MHPAVIGPYSVERELGRGGMGEVFLATDTRLDRRVAIKALPDHLSADAERLARFQREAKVLASMSHPNIGAIHGLEEVEGRQYLILEFVEGETLAERLVSGAIPVEEALSFARQIAEALAAAHDKGVVHRDVKPGNVMVTPEGAVKVLDFGLARTAEGAPSTSSVPVAPNSPTVHSPTIPGVILGTAGYMSPEQARGKPVDKRSDIFSFGCVLFEMLTGACPFPGETVTDSLGAILHREPDWSLLPPQLPPRVRELLATCLSKDRRNRLHDIGDARLELERAIAGHEWAAVARPASGGSRRWSVPAGLVAATAIIAGTGGWLLSRRNVPSRPAAPAAAFHVSTTLPSKPELGAVMGIAPDGGYVLYSATPAKSGDDTKPGNILVVRRLDRDETRVLDATEGGYEAALSPDGRWVAFVAAKDSSMARVTLKKLALDDGRPIGTAETVCELLGGWYTLCWSSDREIVAVSGWQQSILAVPAAGGEPRVVRKGEQSKEIDVWGEVRPLVAGKSILASRWTLVGQGVKERTEVVDLATGTRTVLLANGGGAVRVADDLIVARRNQSSLIASRIDPATHQLIGEPVTVWSGANLSGPFHVSASGVLAMTTRSNDLSQRRLAWLDAQGQPQPLAAVPRAYGRIAVSPDGGRVLTNLESANDTELPTDLWMHDLSRRTFSKLPTSAPSWEFVWSADGQRVAYSVVTPDEFSIWERRADGLGEGEKIYSTRSAQVTVIPSDWSRDGNVLAVHQQEMTSGAEDVLMLKRGAAGEPWKALPYLNSGAAEHCARFSPDGKWVAYCSVESGRHELYVQRFTGAESGASDAAAGRVQVSTSGHDGAAWWSPDGKEIRYIDGDKQVMSVEVQTEPAFSVSLPKLLYSFKELKTGSWSWALDGRVMVVLQGEQERPSRVELVVNFLDEVRAKVAK